MYRVIRQTNPFRGQVECISTINNKRVDVYFTVTHGRYRKQITGEILIMERSLEYGTV